MSQVTAQHMSILNFYTNAENSRATKEIQFKAEQKACIKVFNTFFSSDVMLQFTPLIKAYRLSQVWKDMNVLYDGLIGGVHSAGDLQSDMMEYKYDIAHGMAENIQYVEIISNNIEALGVPFGDPTRAVTFLRSIEGSNAHAEIKDMAKHHKRAKSDWQAIKVDLLYVYTTLQSSGKLGQYKKRGALALEEQGNVAAGDAAKQQKLERLKLDKKNQFCDHCKQRGHLREKCFEITACPNCGVIGHSKYRCPQPKSGEKAVSQDNGSILSDKGCIE
jgi:hypothetical protein